MRTTTRATKTKEMAITKRLPSFPKMLGVVKYVITW